jgi:hypothetical protein
MKSALTSSTMICALVEVSSKRAVEDAGDTQDETRIEEGAKGLTQKVADDILLGEEYENMTTPDAKVRALPGSAATVEIVTAPSRVVLQAQTASVQVAQGAGRTEKSAGHVSIGWRRHGPRTPDGINVTG